MKRVVVGMSGGIDSAVTALLLTRMGYKCIGVQMQYWSEQQCTIPYIGKVSDDKTNDIIVDTIVTSQKPTNRFRQQVDNKCCSDESLLITRSICQKLGMPFYTYNIQDTFKRLIVDPYIQGHEIGETPNPCTQCNKHIKFGELFSFADRIGADYVATGHYARIKEDAPTREVNLYEAQDKQKDQSYFLYTLTQNKLRRIILPLGDLLKTNVKKIAEENGLDEFKKTYRDSQGLCFFPEKTPQSFLERNLSSQVKQEGIIRDYTGREVGKHSGTLYYTIGQRRGLDIGGLPEPYFVISVDRSKNEVIIGPKEKLYQTTLLLRDLHTISKKTPLSQETLQAKLRYRMVPSACTIEKQGSDRHVLKFQKPVFAITPGQVAVIQKGEQILGGGIIEKSIEAS